MTAVFGRLRKQTLELSDGLNIIESPNETGKSTWCAFLTAMFYGINSRERDKAGFIAEKNRYAPWDGAAMQGRLDCLADGQELTLTRETRRQTAPMGVFSAVYSGTGDEVPGLSGLNCGEKLLGVPREVFERSSMIRQSGLSITQDAELERRIVSLITTGEEDTSFTEAESALRKQFNQRRHNKTGQIPAAEADLNQIRQQLQALHLFQAELTAQREQSAQLAQEQSALEQQLLQWQQYEAIQKRRTLLESHQRVQCAQAASEESQRRLTQEQTPENETIARLRGAIVNLETVRKSVRLSKQKRESAQQQLLKAQEAVRISPLAGKSVREAQQSLAAAQARAATRPIRQCLTGSTVVALLVAAALFVLTRLLPAAPLWALVLGGGLTAAILIWLVCRGVLERWQKAGAAQRLRDFGTADLAELSPLVERYAQLLTAQEEAQTAAATATATVESLSASLSSNEQAILLEVRRFAPSAFDIPAADQALRACAVRRKEAQALQTAAREAQLRCEVLSQQLPAAPPLTPEELAATPPETSHATLSTHLEQVRATLASTQSKVNRLEGQIAAIGDPAVLSAQAEQLAGQIADWEREYQSIGLAMEVLDSANTTLQNRFSPELGRRAAEIFARLTDGRYHGVTLDRSFHLAAEPANDSFYRDVQLLSAGAADQLYLAVRLAICEMVLPKETVVPLVLDDTLANFDTQRCQAALAWLRQAAQSRQILLFTCHTREATFFQGDPAVSVQRLTNSGKKV